MADPARGRRDHPCRRLASRRARLVSLGRSGGPDLEWRGARLVRNVRRDPRVAFSVQEERPPFAAVVMRGRAEVASDDGPGIAAEIRRITRRYIEPHEVDAYVREWAALQTIVRIHPDSVTGWNRGY